MFEYILSHNNRNYVVLTKDEKDIRVFEDLNNKKVLMFSFEKQGFLNETYYSMKSIIINELKIREIE